MRFAFEEFIQEIVWIIAMAFVFFKDLHNIWMLNVYELYDLYVSKKLFARRNIQKKNR